MAKNQSHFWPNLISKWLFLPNFFGIVIFSKTFRSRTFHPFLGRLGCFKAFQGIRMFHLQWISIESILTQQVFRNSKFLSLVSDFYLPVSRSAGHCCLEFCTLVVSEQNKVGKYMLRIYHVTLNFSV